MYLVCVGKRSLKVSGYTEIQREKKMLVSECFRVDISHNTHKKKNHPKKQTKIIGKYIEVFKIPQVIEYLNRDLKIQT